ncbi:MAG TPA: ABC transporter permease [Burkholderiales bacterium]|jgi:phospholipid/cholesterol/gamma-HCH transport system permease protein|nr:ABC transporter permease [Burkholderiales bacterium]
MPIDTLAPQLAISRSADGITVTPRGLWNVQGLAQGRGGKLARLQVVGLDQALAEHGKNPATRWDLTQAEAFDHVGALMFWRAWGHSRPGQLLLEPDHEALFDNFAGDAMPLEAPRQFDPFALFVFIGHELFLFADHLAGFVRLLGQLSIDLARFARKPQAGPWREISANLFRSGTQALGITALVGFLIGIVLSYLSARQLKQFGADIFIVDLLGLAIIRELGPVLAAILVAGRSGSAMTASLGVMRVTEELDALTVMGIPHGFRLLMPKVVALAIALPLLVLWTDAVSILGGMVAAKLQLGLSMSYFFNALPAAVKVVNLYIGIGKGVVFGALIALVACHFGLRIEPNTESLGQGTTSSVVASITVVILADAVFAIAFSNVGI